MVGRTLVDPCADEVPVIVANFSLRPKKIQQRVAVAGGLCQEVDQEQQPRTCKRSVVNQDLFARSSQCLEQLLLKYTNVFSAGDQNLGCTNLHEVQYLGLYNPLQKKGQSPKLQSPWEGPYTVVERLSDVTYRIRGRRKAQPKVVHVSRLWQYHGPGQYTWEDAEEQSPTTGEDQTGDPGRTQDCTDLENLTMARKRSTVPS
ncbi:hypothetical protein Hamer_G000082 [Homarus americanus]|uniref:Integrase p58-like C-terminal domain-containing protein n=1 Tax=Homarus americanus TaxID=6706 RepID=A0A8J5NAC6_HOMAM|nr:hypothetical protein Hamer_G000082 [Homarus americanus]